MPTISMFYGILIRMYYAPGEHNPPHFHVVYAEHECSVSLETLEITDGFLPTRQDRFVAAWQKSTREIFWLTGLLL